MAIHPLLDFFAAAVGYIHPDPEAAEQTTDTSLLRYHQKVVLTAIVFGAFSAIASVVLMIILQETANEIGTIVLMPIVFGVAGCIFGTAWACLWAPREFLAGPVGQKWMKLIGTDSVTVARAVCAMVVVAIAGLVPGMMALGAFMQKR